MLENGAAMMVSLDNPLLAYQASHVSMASASISMPPNTKTEAPQLVLYSLKELTHGLSLEKHLLLKKWKLLWTNELNTELVKNERESASEHDCMKPNRSSLLALRQHKKVVHLD